MKPTPTFRLAVIVGIVFTCPSIARAHAVGVEVKLKDGTATVAVFYDDDTPGEDAKVTVTDTAGKVVAEGKADEKGVWSFPAPSPGKYKVAVDAGAGHRTSRTLTVDAPTPTDNAPAAAEAAESVATDGPTRSEFTGPMRLVWAAAGVLAIGLGTWVVMRVLRSGRDGQEPEGGA